MMCWYCHWGWPKPIADIYDKYIKTAGASAMHYGGAHSVWDDENFKRDSVQWCLDHLDEHRHADATNEEHEAVRQSLIDMLALPDGVLDNPSAAAYHESDQPPANFPPPDTMVMVRR